MRRRIAATRLSGCEVKPRGTELAPREFWKGVLYTMPNMRNGITAVVRRAVTLMIGVLTPLIGASAAYAQKVAEAAPVPVLAHLAVFAAIGVVVGVFVGLLSFVVWRERWARRRRRNPLLAGI